MSETTEVKPAAKPPVAFLPLNWRQAVLLVLVAAVCFHAAYTPANSGPLALLIVGYVVCVVQLARLRTTRQSFYTGLLTGLLCYGPQLAFFWNIFGPAAIALWAVLALWLALFVALSHVALIRLGAKRALWLIPFLWTGLEYFRSELYYLKFSWLSVGYAFASSSVVPFGNLGVYGVGFVIVAFAVSLPAIGSLLTLKLNRFETVFAVIIILYVLAAMLFPVVSWTTRKLYFPTFRVAGIQLEFPNENQIKRALDDAVLENNKQVTAAEIEKKSGRGDRRTHDLLNHTNLDLIVLSEYTLDETPTEQLKAWCRDHQKLLIVGGKDPAPGNNFYNTAFVIGTNGEVIFEQAKSVPIQFFKDGLPAPEQKVWDSPWGKIGICICYDLSYSRVTDELVRQGAQMLIVPTMDVAEWGQHQHELHARIAPVRAAEYGIPIFRLASSGISQGVNGSGRVQATAPFPGGGEMIFFGTRLNRPSSLPLDRYLAPVAVFVTGAFVVWLAINSRKPRIKVPRTPA